MCENKNLTMMQGKGKITKLFHFTHRHRNSQETVLQEFNAKRDKDGKTNVGESE